MDYVNGCEHKKKRAGYSEERPTVAYGGGIAEEFGTRFPEMENCENGRVPVKKGKEIYVPEAVTMTKFLFEDQRLALYSYLNRCLKDGTLRKVTGINFTNKVINRGVCDFTHVNYWRIDRKNFFADIDVNLLFSSSEDKKIGWSGYLVLWCTFDYEFSCSIEDLTSEQPDRADMVMLSPYLIPYHKNKDVDKEAEDIWRRYHEEALENPGERIAPLLAEKMGLNIQYLPVSKHKGIPSMLFFSSGKLKVEKKDPKKPKMDIVETEIPGNTIVINSNEIQKDFWAFSIFHECYHHEDHYLFYCLQKQTNSDPKAMKWKKVVVDDNFERNDPVYWMEKQANRGAYGLMMPATSTAKMINAICSQIQDYRHDGDLFEKAGYWMYRELCGVPYFRIRARMIQLGHLEAKGAFNYADKEKIEAFAFNIDSLRADEHSFVVEPSDLAGLKEKDLDLSELLDSGKFIYADGHVVRNTESCVRRAGEKLLLTDWANAHVDQCCLRFVREYVQAYPGRYEFGRMYFDPDYHKQTMLYAGDLINERNIDIADVEDEYKKIAPQSFNELVEKLRKTNGMTKEEMAEKMNTNVTSLRRWLSDPRYYRTVDFIASICFIFETPIWLSRIIFKKAKVSLDDDDARDKKIRYLLEQHFTDGIEYANNYLKSRNMHKLTIG